MKNLELTEDQRNFLNYYTKGIWTYNADTGLVDVAGSFKIPQRRLRYTSFKDFEGVKFGKVCGDFHCAYNSLTSLEGAPQEVGGVSIVRGTNLYLWKEHQKRWVGISIVRKTS